MTVIEFLEARLAEDEAIARAAMHEDALHNPGEWTTEHHNSAYNEQPDACHIAEDRKGVYWTVASEVYIPNAEHMARHDPARALREIAAKRALIENARMYPDAEFPDFAGGFSTASESALEELAKVWPDHPEYQEDWDE